MSQSRDYTLAAIIGLGAFALAAFWPSDETAPDPDPDPDPPIEEPVDPDPEPDPEPDPDPVDPDPEPDPEPDPPAVLTDWYGNEFSYLPAGDIYPGSGTGQTEQADYAPGMRFPIELPAAFANSQVYKAGGGSTTEEGWQCSATNYEYPWQDNFCETRGYSTPFCPAGTGHQGQDIRPPACPPTTDDAHDDFWAVATADGDITGTNGHVVSLLADDGTRYLYLHLDPDSLLIEPGDRVSRGERLGVISNYFGGTPTTYHLHFEIRQSVMIDGELTQTPVPPYLSLVDSYERLLAGEEGTFDPPPF